MRAAIHRIIQILDNTHAEYAPPRRQRQSGQSVVELALITPILIVMFAGMVEIGWFANNYLTILDVTRAGARRATTLQDQLSPREWEVPLDPWSQDASWVPQARFDPGTESHYIMPYRTGAGVPTPAEQEARRALYRNPIDPVTGTCQSGTASFYNEVVCTMVTSMLPLPFRGDNGVDDIIVSGFALKNVDGSRYAGAYLGPNRPLVGQNVPQIVVVGRFPSNANECDVQEVPAGSGTFVVSPLEPRDPFDFDQSGGQTVRPVGDVADGITDFTEMVGFDPVRGTAAEAEKQVGFSWFGNRRIPNTACVGSDWTVADVERLMNLPNYTVGGIPERNVLPSQSLVIVEMFWEHDFLLQLPVFNPVFDILSTNRTISVWAAFPLPSVEPYEVVFPD